MGKKQEMESEEKQKIHNPTKSRSCTGKKYFHFNATLKILIFNHFSGINSRILKDSIKMFLVDSKFLN